MDDLDGLFSQVGLEAKIKSSTATFSHMRRADTNKDTQKFPILFRFCLDWESSCAEKKEYDSRKPRGRQSHGLHLGEFRSLVKNRSILHCFTFKYNRRNSREVDGEVEFKQVSRWHEPMMKERT